jgi:hypothetical protein
LKHGSGKRQLTLQIGRVQNEKNSVRTGYARHPPCQNIAGDLLILRTRNQAVDSGKIDQVDFPGAFQGRTTDVLLHRDPGKVRDLLTKTCKAIEKSGFATVGRTYQSNRVPPREFTRRKSCRRH